MEKGIFTTSNSEIFTGKLKEVQNGNRIFKTDYSVLYKCTKNESHVHFVFYDYKALYYSKQSFNEIKKLNSALNPSLHFTEIDGLVNFIFDSIIKVENGVQIFQVDNEINFELIVDIVKVRWSFNCKIINDYEAIQDLFVKPMINTLFGLQMFLSSSANSNAFGTNKSEINIKDASLAVENFDVNKTKNFNTHLCKLFAISTPKFKIKEESSSNQKENKGKRTNKKDEDEPLKKQGKKKETKKQEVKKKKKEEEEEESSESESSGKKEKLENNLIKINQNNDKKKKKKLEFF